MQTYRYSQATRNTIITCRHGGANWPQSHMALLDLSSTGPVQQGFMHMKIFARLLFVAKHTHANYAQHRHVESADVRCKTTRAEVFPPPKATLVKLRPMTSPPSQMTWLHEDVAVQGGSAVSLH